MAEDRQKVIERVKSDLMKRENAMRWLSKQNQSAEDCRDALANEADFLAKIRAMLESGSRQRQNSRSTS